MASTISIDVGSTFDVGFLDFSSLKLYTEAWTVFLLDAPLPIPHKDIRKFFRTLQTSYEETVNSYSRLYDALCRAYDGDMNWTVDPLMFKKTPIFRIILELSRGFNIKNYRYCLSFLAFGKRVPTQDPKSIEQKALDSWLAVEERISEVKPADWWADLKFVLDTLLLPHYTHVPLPIHGGGAVSEKGVRSPHEKNKALYFHPRIMKSLFLPRTDFADFLPDEMSHRCEISQLVSQLLFVPKSLTSLRSICKEPAICQWSQQSIRKALEDSIEKSVLSRFIRIDDQSYNALLSQQSSELLSCDTVDLSSASDSLTLEVVKAVFPRRILYDLLATRSTHIKLPGGRIVRPFKFAPMGSAVCFPVQTIFYTSVMLLAYHWYVNGPVKMTKRNLFGILEAINDDPYSVEGLRPIRAYGDDLICDTRITNIVVSMLNNLGFVVNAQKSFTGNVPFRESCGGYYLNGADVTPFSLKTGEFGKASSPRLISSLIEASNRCYELGYVHLRQYLLTVAHMFKIRGKDRVPYHLDYSADGVHGPHVIDVAYRIRLYNPDKVTKSTCYTWQRDEVRVQVVSSVVVKDSRDERYLYTRWMRAPYAPETGQSHAASMARAGQKLRLRWVWKPV